MPRFSECWRCGNTVGVGIICNLCDVAKYCSEKCQKNDIFRHEAECIPASILKTCTTCRKSGPNLKACTGCYRAFYCDAKCQKSNWKRHKIDCLEHKKRKEEITQLILAHFNIRSEKTVIDSYYYWGNEPAFDCLNLVENEGVDELAFKCLFLGVGDLRNVALTCASLPESYSNKVLFTLNDKEVCVLARLVLFLYMLIKDDVAKEKTVTEIWYSVLLSETTYKSLRASLQELVHFASAQNLRLKTAGLIIVDEIHFKQLQEVWKTWLGLRVQGTKWIQKQREQAIHSNMTIVAQHARYTQNVPVEHANGVKKWIKDGVFKRTQAPTLSENPTLTGVDSAARHAPYSYSIPPGEYPFSGWDYLEVKKFKRSSCLVSMFGDYIEHILRNLMKKLAKEQVSFHIVPCDCMDIKKYLEEDPVYDRILTSNLMDYVFLPNLLKLCSEILNRNNHHATIITESALWDDIIPEGGLSCPSTQLQIPKLMKMALEDGKRYPFTKEKDGGFTVIEYLENSSEFYNYLRAIFYAFRCQSTADSASANHKPGIPVIKELGHEFQLRLRDGIRNENRIVFFRHAINKRKVTAVSGTERYLEWVPLQK